MLVPVTLADTINVSSSPDAEIVDLLRKVNDEIASRGVNKIMSAAIFQ